jgi:hypothetical protein
MRKNKISKKGELFSETSGIIIAVICVVLLVGLFILIYNILVNDEYKAASKTLDFITKKINYINNEKKTRFLIRGIGQEKNDKRWILIGWGKNEEGRPDKCYFKSCLCICPFNKESIKNFLAKKNLFELAIFGPGSLAIEYAIKNYLAKANKEGMAAACQKGGICKTIDSENVEISMSQAVAGATEAELRRKGKEGEKTIANSRMVILKPMLIQLEASKTKKLLQINDLTSYEPESSIMDWVRAACFISKDTLDMEDVAGEVTTDISAIGLAQNAQTIKQEVTSGTEILIKERINVEGLSPYLDSIKGFKESTAELAWASKGAVIKHFPDKGIYNVVWEPTTKKVIGQVTSQGYIRQISDEMATKLGSDIGGVFGTTGGKILAKSPKLAGATEILTKEGQSLGKLEDLTFVASKRTLKLIPKDGLLQKVFVKVGGKALGKVVIVWGIACDLTTAGIAISEADEMLEEISNADDATKAAEDAINNNYYDSADKQMDSLRLRLEALESYSEKLKSLPNINKRLAQLRKALADARGEGLVLQAEINEFYNNDEAEKGENPGKFTYCETYAIRAIYRNLVEQLVLLDKEFAEIESVISSDTIQDLTPKEIKFNVMKSADFSLQQQSWNFFSGQEETGNLNDYTLKNQILENGKETGFYLRHLKDREDFLEFKTKYALMLADNEIGDVKENKIVIDNGKFTDALSKAASGKFGEDYTAERDRLIQIKTKLAGASLQCFSIFVNSENKGI